MLPIGWLLEKNVPELFSGGNWIIEQKLYIHYVLGTEVEEQEDRPASWVGKAETTLF